MVVSQPFTLILTFSQGEKEPRVSNYAEVSNDEIEIIAV
jgi:hypothetical protein